MENMSALKKHEHKCIMVNIKHDGCIKVSCLPPPARVSGDALQIQSEMKVNCVVVGMCVFRSPRSSASSCVRVSRGFSCC